MAEYIYPAAVLLTAFSAACAIVLGAVGGLQMTRKLPVGVMHYFFAALVLSNGLAVLVSTRNYAYSGELFETQLTANPLASWAIRLTSLLALMAAADQVARWLRLRLSPGSERLFLGAALVAFWLGNILIPSQFSAHTSSLQLSWVYTPILGIGLLLLPPEAGRQCVLYARNAIIAFCAVSLLLIVVKPTLVMQGNYTQGYLGISRFAGLAPHAITMGLVACVGVWILITMPLRSRFRQRVAMGICLLALFLAQSKAVWITLIVTLPLVLFNGRKAPSFQAIAQSRHRGLIVVGIALVALALAGAVAFVAVGGLDARFARLLASDEGSRIMSMTGRDRIWEVALAEWAKAPIFGYGLPLFGLEHQIQIQMPFATSGHNQFIDTLARSGLVGAIALTVYTLLLLHLGVKYRHASGGLSAALVLAMVLRMVSEVPLNMTTVGLESMAHYLLLVTIAMGLPSKKPVASFPSAPIRTAP